LAKLPSAEGDVADLLNLRKGLRGLKGEEGVAADVALSKVESEIDRLMPGVMAKLEEADANYNAFKTASGLDKRITKAELQTAGAHSGLNLGNKLRQTATSAATNPREARYMRPQEVAALEDLSRGTTTQNLMRYLGNAIGGGGGPIPIGLGMVGSY